MAVAPPIDALFSATAHRRFGLPREFGFATFGKVMYGDEFAGVIFEPFGVLEFGSALYGHYLNLSGIYQRRQMKIGRQTVLEKYMCPKDPGDPVVAANRVKFGDAVRAWQALSLAQKKVYNDRVWGRSMYGYNLFIKEFIHG